MTEQKLAAAYELRARGTRWVRLSIFVAGVANIKISRALMHALL